MEVTIGSDVYRTGKLEGMKQFHITRRLGPALFALGQGLLSFRNIARSAGEVVPPAPPEGVATDSPEGQAAVAEESAVKEATLLEAFKPIADVLAKLTDEDSEYIIHQCLQVCHKKQAGGWAPCRVNGRLMFEDMDMQTMMTLTMSVLQENLAGFFSAPAIK